MDRLISEKQVLDAICHDKCGLSPNRCISGITGECVQIKPIKAIPSAEPYKGMTNGEVLEEVFGSNFYPPLVFCADWYKEPYKRKQESEDKE